MPRYDVFLSYAHHNNHDGRVTAFKRQLESLLLEYLGRPFHVFQDDKALETGDLWEEKIAEALETSTVFIAILTPSYFEREWCSREVQTFLDRHEKAGKTPILIPIYWLKTPRVDRVSAHLDHPIASRVARRQYANWLPLFAKPLTSSEVRERLVELVEDIMEKLEASDVPLTLPPPTSVKPLVVPPPKPTVRPRSKPRKARLEIENAPTNATVTVNGDALTESWFEVELADGEMTREVEVIVATLGYEVMEWDVTIVAGETAKIDARLTKIPVAVVKPRLVTPPAPKLFTPPLTLAEYKAQMITIPAGEFIRGDGDIEDAKPQARIYLSEYKIGIVPVTVGMYEEFSQATGYSIPESPDFNEGWAKKDHPMVNVSWQTVATFASWAGLLFPSEAQWEKAARGEDGRKYPWGDDWKPELLHWSENKDKYGGGTAPVGSYLDGESPYHVLDMAGNVWEWCLDWYHEKWFSISDIRNPKGPQYGDDRVLRGGSWSADDPDWFRCADRFWEGAKVFDNVGFRLVSTGS